ncbi:unnamed protein product [Schistocephalus solidus]|uniref:Uncharacterized protein n=1 Tax=Schistocephalus solidus TaxID=70667 RepID=A0A183SHK8_SCHSO|nr:unnamed protein product [Schistocephalus solidus]
MKETGKVLPGILGPTIRIKKNDDDDDDDDTTIRASLMWELAHWLTGRRTRLRAKQHDLAPITHTPGFTYSGDMEKPSPSDSQSTGQPLDTHSTYTEPRAWSPSDSQSTGQPLDTHSTYTGPTSWSGVQSEPHLGDNEAVICPSIGIKDCLGYQHVLSISPPDEKIVQQLPTPRPMVHPRGLLLRRKAEECVG